jgi:putative membrane protein
MDLEWLLFNGSRATIALSGLLVVSGVILIKLGRRSWHKRAMASAAVLALVFVALYLVKSALYPPEKYEGAYRGLYLFILWSHTVLSIVNMPLAVVTIYLALKERFPKHKRIAPYTAAVWIYVAASGWMIFLFHQ